MDNKINEIRKQIKAIRVSMLEAEAIMHDQISRDEECSEVAREIMVMRAAMSLLVAERARLETASPSWSTASLFPVPS
jgi:hypothetical protein